MANTTNFGWETPDDTDLVKDGAAAMRTLGSAIDTSMMDLKGGTSGQILSKNSNTDMDFVWIANDQGDITGVTASAPLTGGGTSGAITVGIQDGTTAQKGAVQLTDSTSSTSTTTAATPNSVKSAYDLANGAIPKTLTTTTGDIIYASSANTPARLAIGSTDQVLKVSGGVPVWGAAGSGAMVLTGSATFSAATSINIDSCFSSSYENYIFQFDGVSSSSGDNVYIRFRSGGSTDTTSNYFTQELLVDSTTLTGSRGTGAQETRIARINTGYMPSWGTIKSPYASKPKLIWATSVTNNSGTPGAYTYWAGFTDTTSFDGINIWVSVGNITGTMRIYGLVNS